MFNFNHLYYFYIVAKSGSTTIAAKHLRISQPSLSSQIKVLEESLNMKLFRKVGRCNRLTESGVVILGFCRRMFDVSEELGEVILERVPSAVRRINIGISHEISRNFVVDVVSLFLKKHQDIQRPKVNMVSGSHEELVQRLRFHELDAIVTQQALVEPELTNLIIVESPVILLCSSQYMGYSKLFSKSKVNLSPASIRNFIGDESITWVMPSLKSKLRVETDLFFGKNKLKGRVLLESDSIAAITRSVVDDIGLAFLPKHFVTAGLKDKSLRLIGPKDGFWNHQIWLGCHHQSSGDILIQSLLRSFKDVCDQILI